MTFKKQFTQTDFKNALSTSWQKSSDIADKIGCSRDHVTKTLLIMEGVEHRIVTGGRFGTREWRLK